VERQTRRVLPWRTTLQGLRQFHVR